MSLADAVRLGIALAHETTAALQAEVRHSAWIADGGVGEPVYAAPVVRQAIVEQKQSMVRNAQGEVVLASTKITLLVPIEGLGVVGRREPIDPRDEFLLPDGTTGPILAVSGLVDPDTNYPYMHEVYLG